MAKKKNIATEPATLTPEKMTEARALFAEDPCVYTLRQLKKVLTQKLAWSRGAANAGALALMEEGPVVTVRGETYYRGKAAEPVLVEYRDEALTDADGKSVPAVLDKALPGDLYEAYRGYDGFVLDRFVRHTKLRWLVRLEGHADGFYTMVTENAYEPIYFRVPDGLKPRPQSNAVYEVEVDEQKEKEGDVLLDYEDYLAENWEGFGYRNFTWPARIVRRIARRDEPAGALKIAEERHGIRTEFPDEVKIEAKEIPQEVTAAQRRGRVDLRDVPFVTIDGEDARDFDDAVYCEKSGDGWRLLVAIADVSQYVKPDHPLDREAQARGTSVYFPTAVIPMLPEALSNGICSLNPNVDRLTMVCDALIDSEGKTTAYQFYPAVIRSHARLTYTQVWSALSGEEAGFEALGERLFEVERLYELYQVLHAAREKRFALDFESSEIKALINEEKGTIDRFEPYRITDANRLIEECMLVANVAAADFVLRNEKLTLFRVHDKPEEERLQDLRRILRAYKLKLSENSPSGFAKLLEAVKKSPSTSPLQIAVLRTMSRALYSPDNIGHYGLQYEHYAHFTSPIRRYPDLMLHRTIKAILAKRTYHPKLYSETGIEGFHAQKLGFRPAFEKPVKELPKTERDHEVWRRLGLLCSIAERRADDASRDVMNWLACEWLSKRPNVRYASTVVNVLDSGVIVRLDDSGLEGYVHVSNLGGDYFTAMEGQLVGDEGEVIRIGKQMQVVLDEVDFEKRRFSFRRAFESGKRQKKGRRRYDWYDDVPF